MNRSPLVWRLVRSSVLVGVICVSLLAGTGGRAGARSTAAKHFTIGLTLLSLQYPFLDTLYSAAKQEAAKEGVTLIGVDPRQSVAAELSQVQDLISKKVDAIIMIPVDFNASAAAATLINKAHIPLFLCNTQLSSTFALHGGRYVSYIGSNDLDAGIIQGTFTVFKLQGRGNIIYLVTQYGGSSTELRKQGFYQVIRDYPGLHVVTELAAQGSRATAKTTMENLLARYKPGTVQAVVAQNDEMALGALSAITAAHRTSDFKLVMGVDAEPAGVAAVRAGTMTSSVFQDAVGQGRGVVQTAVKYLNGSSVPADDDIPFKLVWSQTINTIFPK